MVARGLGWMAALACAAMLLPAGSGNTQQTAGAQSAVAAWTEDMFVKAMKGGKHMGTSREIQPPMPWPWIGQATDEDLKGIFAYLRSVPPIVNHVPDWQQPAAPGQAAPGKPAPKK